jgi:hypothetical protein
MKDPVDNLEGVEKAAPRSESSKYRSRNWLGKKIDEMEVCQKADFILRLLSSLRKREIDVPGITFQKTQVTRVSAHLWTDRQLRYQVQCVLDEMEKRKAFRFWIPDIIKEKIVQICSDSFSRY